MDRRLVHTAQTDHHQPCGPVLGAEGAVEIGVDPGANRLNYKAHWLSRNGDEALEAQDPVLANGLLHARKEAIQIADLAQRDRKTVERVMVVITLMIFVISVIFVICDMIFVTVLVKIALI